MDSQLSAERIHGYIRLAIPLMSKHGIPVTPMNYSVWYKYVSGTDGELSKTIDAILADGQEFSSQKNEELYRQFCAEKGDYEIRKIREDLHLILMTILKQVTELSGHNEEYESFVSDSVNMLSENASLQDIRNVVSEIIHKTKTLGKFGKTLKHKLTETTKALEVLKKDFEQVKTEVFVDFLTGVANRKALDDALTKIAGEAAAGAKELCFLLIDIDRFKGLNDKFGHLIGDEVLKFVAKKIKEIVRGRDFVARFGGEEFAVILPQTPIAGAEVVAESIRNFFAQASMKSTSTSQNLGILTVSIGVALYRPGEPLEKFIGRCDQALYDAKHAGRNRVARERGIAAGSV